MNFEVTFVNKSEKNYVFSRMRLLGVTLALIICLVDISEAKTKKSKSVTTLLEAKWLSTPLVLEVAEYLADENVDYYWSFIDSLSSLEPPLKSIGL